MHKVVLMAAESKIAKMPTGWEPFRVSLPVPIEMAPNPPPTQAQVIVPTNAPPLEFSMPGCCCDEDMMEIVTAPPSPCPQPRDIEILPKRPKSCPPILVPDSRPCAGEERVVTRLPCKTEKAFNQKAATQVEEAVGAQNLENISLPTSFDKSSPTDVVAETLEQFSLSSWPDSFQAGLSNTELMAFLVPALGVDDSIVHRESSSR